MDEFGRKTFIDLSFSASTWLNRGYEERVRIHIPGWDEAVKQVGAKASFEDLEKIKDSLSQAYRRGQLPYVKFVLGCYEEFGIDIKQQYKALEFIKFESGFFDDDEREFWQKLIWFWQSARRGVRQD